MNTQNKKEKALEARPPIIVIMGHIDHGKSALLDYIRKTSIVDTEAGGITQHLSAYEVDHTTKDDTTKRITFLDTPGHEAFEKMRARGANAADIAILIVSAEDGVKTQTKEALAAIRTAGIPFIVAINKIDLPNADVNRTKQDLAENEILVEGYGGDVPCVAISAKTGEGISELLDMMLLVAEVEELHGDTEKAAQGVVIESSLNPKTGISATLIIIDGSIAKGMWVTAEESISPVRLIANFKGEHVDEAHFSSPIRITGWNTLPAAGAEFHTWNTKKEAEKHIATWREGKTTEKATVSAKEKDMLCIPIIIKTDVAGTLEAVEREVRKLDKESIRFKVINKGAGNISENDLKLLSGAKNAIIVGFNVKADTAAKSLAEKFGVTIQNFTIIYKLSEWLEAEMVKRAPRVVVDETTGTAKIIKVFSSTKTKQVVGGKVTNGLLPQRSEVKILRRDNVIGSGKVVELQAHKVKTDKVEEGNEFGAMIESSLEIAPGDVIEAYVRVEKKSL